LHGVGAAAAAIVVWLVWSSRARYALKAATLSTAAFLATPYAFAYDFAVLAIPVAFLAADQMRCGLRRGEQTTLLALFGVSLVVLASRGSLPLGPIIVIALLALILRRVVRAGQSPCWGSFVRGYAASPSTATKWGIRRSHGGGD
jgi:hypothetical protein